MMEVLLNALHFLESLLFVSIFGVPLIVLWLGAVGVFLTVRLKFINIFGLKHAFDIVRGKFNSKNSKEEVTPFQALMSSMAATIGTGSIVGVAVVVSKGGAGAVFWMMVFGFFGMTIKFTEVFLGHKYRKINEDGSILGGPFIYLKDGLAKMRFAKLGSVLALIFALCGFVGVLGIAGFQSNQVVTIVAGQNSVMLKKVIISLLATAFTAYILLGGVKRLSSFADKMVPLMVLLYVGTVLYIIITHLPQAGLAFKKIFHDAFDFSSGMTAFLAMVTIGARRALFACEAGQGTSPIINSTSNVKFSERQGMVNLFDPLITTWVVCLSTSLALIISGLYQSGEIDGAILVKQSFASFNSAFGYVVVISILFFALTTLTTDSYYFNRIAKHLKVSKSVTFVIFFVFIFIAGIVSLDAIIAFADIFVLLMAIVNTFGLYFLAGEVARDLKNYFKNNKNSQ